MVSKKGIIFTMVSVVLSAIVIASFFYSTATPPDQSVAATKIRIDSVNNYIEQLDFFVQNQVSIYTRSAVKNMSFLIYNNSHFFDAGQSFEQEFVDCATTGRVHNPGTGGTSSSNCGSNLALTLTNMDNIAINQLNINSSTTVTSIELYQDSPWYVKTRVNISIVIADGYATWRVNKSIVGNASILGLPDPTYFINVNGLYPANDQYINNFSTPVPWNGWIRYPSTLNALGLQREYFFYDEAPSFLDRMNGDLNNQNSQAGIAAIVLPAKGVFPNSNIANLDFVYWRRQACNSFPATLKNLKEMDFFNETLIDPEERANLNITESGIDTINGSFFPENLLQEADMNYTNYYKPAGCP